MAVKLICASHSPLMEFATPQEQYKEQAVRDAFAKLAEKARRAAKLRQDPVHGGNQHKEHHDVHDDFVNSHRLYSLLVVIYWRMRRKRLIRPTCAIP